VTIEEMMTIEKMMQMTLDTWRMYFPKKYRKLGKERALVEARACALLTRSEMDTIKMMVPGMSDYEAWTEARTLFCIAPPPEIDEDEPSLTSEEEACLAEAREDVTSGSVSSFEDAWRELFPKP
jgi:hypothetical protein